MFNPTREQVRAFFVDTWRKYRAGTPLVGLEALALDLLVAHPEYHALLDDPEAATREWTPEGGETNPFLHLSMHLAIEEQLSIDQPPGVRAAFDRIVAARGDRHAAMHAALECLGEMMWTAQRNGTPPDGLGYVDCLRRQV
jgi:hypothetical protein